MVGKERPDRPGAPRRWAAFTFAALAALVVAVLVLPWTPWPGGEFGHAPWWVSVPLVAAAVLLLVGVGERKYTAWATAGACVAMVAGVACFLTWPSEEVVVDGRTYEQIRAVPYYDVPSEWWLRLHAAEPPAAPLACALVAAAVLVLGVVVLVRGPEPWTAPDVEPGSDHVEGELRDRFGPARRLVATGLVGLLVGGLLGAGTAHGAGELRRERMEALGPWWGPLAESVPVPGDRLHEGAVEWDGDRREFAERLPERASRITWERDFAGALALSTCVLDGRARATLVELEESDGHSVIRGHDARDGAPRWSLTVHRLEKAQLTQVAVGEGCHTMVLIGAVLLAVDTYTGEVVGSSLLPSVELDTWRFMTPAPTRAQGPRLVSLRESEYAYVTSPQLGIYGVRRSDATIVSAAGSTSWCEHLAGHDRRPRVADVVLVAPCSDMDATVVWVPRLEPPEELREQRPPAYRRPPLQPLRAALELPVRAPPSGCSRGPLQLRSVTTWVTVESEMDCAGRKHRARLQLWDGNVLLREEEWKLAPSTDTAPDLVVVRTDSNDLLEVRGDEVTMLGNGEFDPWWSVVPQPGDPVVGLADLEYNRGRRLDGVAGRAGHYRPILALTRSGTLVDLANFYYPEASEPVRVIATSDVARQPCAAERGLLVDKASGTALVLCTANGRTHVTAVTEPLPTW